MRRLRPRAAAGALAAAVGALMAAGAARAAGSSEACLACHADASLTAERRGRTVSLHVDAAALERSAHAGLACADCHAGLSAEELPHAARIAPIDCRSCHGDVAGTHAFHHRMSEATGRDGPPPASCKGCHGTHAVAARASPDFPFASAGQVESCGRCHRAVAEMFSRSGHGRALASGASGAPSCLGCHAQAITRARWSATAAELKLAQEALCLSCHLEDPRVRAKMGPGAGFIGAYERSVHGAALRSGNQEAAGCVDCHGSHEMERGSDPSSRVSQARIPETCARCHAGEARAYGESIHAAAVARGVAEAPVCTTCHGEHDILMHTDPNAPVAPANVSVQVCTPCHSSIRLSNKYGLASDRFETFADSFHGLAMRGGSVEVANCASCHGSHAIKPSSDPTSSVAEVNLAATCGACHPGANERFAAGSVHVKVEKAGEEPILYWIASLYVALIIATVGAMLAHNLLDFARKWRHRRLARLGAIEEPPAGRALYPRMSLTERLQHGALAISFTLLVLTGFMLRYPDAWWVAGIRSLSDRAFELRSLLHRAAAVVMIAAAVWHVLYVALSARGRRLLRDLLPRPADASDAFRMIAYNAGLTRTRPLFDRFGYVEKSEYWALVWGTIVMAVTGVGMWFENGFIGLFGKIGWDVARTVHFYEAWLATLAILVWHVYYVMFNPEVYPMNMAWLTGTLTESEMAEEHPLELEALRREAEAAEAAAEAGDDRDGARASG